MNPFDLYVTQFFASLASHHWTIDWLLYLLASSNFLKGQILMLLFWFLWFRQKDETRTIHEVLIATLLAAVFALAVGRLLVWSLPLRLRPINNPAFDFHLPFPGGYWKDSSMPSDHAVLFFALAMGLFYASRVVGSIALLYVSVVVCFPRIYLGYHYPTDILAGAAIGVGIATFFKSDPVRIRLTAFPLRLYETMPGVFYITLFALTYQIADLFDPVRNALAALYHSKIPL